MIILPIMRKKKSESEKPDTGEAKFMDFMAISISVTPQASSDHQTNHDDSESEKEHGWKKEYQTLFEKTMKMIKLNEKVIINWKDSEEQNSSLKLNQLKLLQRCINWRMRITVWLIS